ncbi:MAG TPA: nickel-binding protein [Woeseiaceae bacterium]|nr:nickel-binding protein [Woeseiaceae bacterium]
MPSRGPADVFVEWVGPATEDWRSRLEMEEVGCFRLHGLEWQESFIAEDGQRRLCRFRAPDAESVRIAFRQAGLRVDAVWSGTLIEVREDDAAAASVLEWPFAPPSPADATSALARAHREGFGGLGFEPVRVIVPADRRRIICFGAFAATVPARGRPAATWRFRHLVAPSVNGKG